MEKHTMLYPSAYFTFFILSISWTACAPEAVTGAKVQYRHLNGHHHLQNAPNSPKLFVFGDSYADTEAVTGAKVQYRHLNGHHHLQNAPNSPKLFVFGDSYADTGNSPKSTAISWKKPYGVSFPGKPSGRFSDGRVLTDYIASFLGTTSPVPFNEWLGLGEKSALENGLNFAQGGTGVFTTLANGPNMTTQINVFQQLVQEEEVYSPENMSSSVALVSVAGNDYAAYFGKSGTNENISDLINITKSIMSQLVLDLQRIHGLGVRRVGVTAMHPLGCLPITTASMSHKNCSENGNSLAKFHNQMLQENIENLNNEAGAPVFVILDLYSAFMSALNLQNNHPGNSTFEDQLSPCCVGTERGYTCGSVKGLGIEKYIVCEDLKQFFWDDIHPSQQGWEAVYSALKPSLQSLLN
ncbi:GDSL esterase/lipase At5g03610-like [Coffea eugenioides]|uniref:GDSL esterase/lipase At5g03610-like n=1 Tax=Coffea eugenioides TaxID=49369 RepID=UPI000F615BA4|nr:GDSL esterase/lipase At5g03610-like [Coffea eugenioides]